MKHILLLILSVMFPAMLGASEPVEHHHANIVQRVIAYFDDSNKPKTEKAFDFSIIGGPHYSSDRGFGLGLVAAGLYRHDRADSLLQPSAVSLYGNATTGKYFNVGIEGLHIFPRDRYRLQYNVYFQSFDTKYWGIGYQSNICDSLESRYQYFRTEAMAAFTFHVAKSIYIGPLLSYTYVKGAKLQHPELWHGLPLSASSVGLGVTFRYDTRDIITNAWHGAYIAIDQKVNAPKWFGTTEITTAYYTPVWKGGVMAAMLNGRFTYGNTPWQLLSTFGGGNLMRGYYEGRYRDKCAMVACIELRQHIYARSGIVVWGGAGKIFPNLKCLNFNHLLPNFGIGYRWEFKQRVNIRLDYGFGRDCSGFVFNINEAF